MLEVMNVEWYDDLGKRHIAWGVKDPEAFKEDLIRHNVDESTIEIYEKDVSQHILFGYMHILNRYKKVLYILGYIPYNTRIK